MIRTRLLLFVAQLFAWSSIVAAIKPAEFIEHVVLYGGKTSNLMELQKVTPELNKQDPGHYEIPAFMGISDREVRAYLIQKRVFEKIQKLWHEFQKKQDAKATTISTDAAAVLSTIQDAMRDAFSGKTDRVFESKQISDFLNKAKNESKLLMVRSTGKEDSKSNVNAGGNESIAAVNPDAAAVTKAIGEVVASYFSQRSITQRLMVKDRGLLSPRIPLFMPVLIQIMIGEPIGGSAEEKDIPVSGVMFSREAEGGTPGVTHIQATYGHNEGVVNGTVAFDTFYIGPSLVVHPLVQIKHERLVPTAGSTLERKENPIALQTKPCLSPELLIALKKCADAIDTYYNEPDGMDIEFVVQHGTVYIVQARPIANKKIEPSYLKKEFVQAVNPTNKSAIIVISAGGGQAQTITAPESVIIADTIGQAYDTFLYKTQNKDAIKTVALGQMAPSMSHEINMLRGAGKQVIYAADLAPIKAWLAGTINNPLLIDTQREIIVKFVPTQALAQAVEPGATQIQAAAPATQKTAFATATDTIEQGWLTHPIAKKISLFPQFITTLTPAQATELKLENLMPQEKFYTIMNLIQEADAATAQKALKTLLFHVAHTVILEKKAQKKEVDPTLIDHFSAVFAHMRTTAYETYTALKTWEQSGQTPEDMVARLYPVTFLQTLIKQIPSKNLFVNDYSLGSLLKTEKQEQTIAQKLKITGPQVERIIQYAKASHAVLTDELKNDWLIFLKNFNAVSDPALHNNFAQVVHNVARMDILPLWVNTSFAQAAKEKDAKKIATTLVQEFDVSQAFIAELQKKSGQLATLTIPSWEDPAKFTKLWHDFSTQFVDYFTNPTFTNAYTKAPDLGKLAALSVMQKFVSVFDASIKTLEASRAYVGNDAVIKKVQHFRTMIEGYFNTLEQWATLLEHDATLVQKLLKNKPGDTLQGHLGIIQEMIRKTIPYNTARQFLGLPQFNAAAAALGSAADWVRSTVGRTPENEPNKDAPTLENLFSLVHQNLLIILSCLTKQTSIASLPQPPLVTQLIAAIEKNIANIRITDISNININLIGTTFDNQIITYFYNIPLASHSATVQIDYNSTKKEATITATLLGESRARWGEIAQCIAWVNEEFNLTSSKKPDVDEKRGLLYFGWRIKNNSPINLIAYSLKAAMAASLAASIFSTSTDPIEIFMAHLFETLGKDEKVFIKTAQNPRAQAKIRQGAIRALFEKKAQLSPSQQKNLVMTTVDLAKNMATEPSITIAILPTLLVSQLHAKELPNMQLSPQQTSALVNTVYTIAQTTDNVDLVDSLQLLLYLIKQGHITEPKDTSAILDAAINFVANERIKDENHIQQRALLQQALTSNLPLAEKDRLLNNIIKFIGDTNISSRARENLLTMLLTSKELQFSNDEVNKIIDSAINFAETANEQTSQGILTLLLASEPDNNKTSSLSDKQKEYAFEAAIKFAQNPANKAGSLVTSLIGIQLSPKQKSTTLATAIKLIQESPKENWFLAHELDQYKDQLTPQQQEVLQSARFE